MKQNTISGLYRTVLTSTGVFEVMLDAVIDGPFAGAYAFSVQPEGRPDLAGGSGSTFEEVIEWLENNPDPIQW